MSEEFTKRLTRRKFIALTGGALAASSLLAACGDATVAPTAAAPAATTAAAPAATTAAAAATTAASATTAAGATTAAASATTAAAATTAASATTAAAATAKPAASVEGNLVIWLDPLKRKALEPLIKNFTAQNNIQVTLQEINNGSIQDQLKLAGPAGQGPDMVALPHDVIGELISNGLIEPIDVGTKVSSFDPNAIKAFTYNTKLYAVPYGTEAIALVYNKDLVPTPPKTWEELKSVAKKLQDDKKAEFGFSVQQGDPYFSYPFFSGFGGYVFGRSSDGSYNPKDLGLDNDGSKAGAAEIDSMVKAGLLKKDITYDIKRNNFFKGKAAMMLTGPWDLPDLVSSKVNFGVANIPTMKQEAHPFLGAQGFLISTFSKNKLLAKSFLTDFIATDEAMKAIYAADPRYPAWIPIQGGIDPNVKAFGEQAKVAEPMPAIPEMVKVWDNWGKAITFIFQQQVAPDKAMTDAGTAIRALLK